MSTFVISGYQVRQILSDRFRLDGGSMFGAVPKALWERLIPADERNRIELASRLLLIEGHGRRLLVDTGMGGKWKSKERDIFAIESLQNLANLSSKLAITDIFLTHLHFDHAGGLSTYTDDGELVLTFPDATHFIQQDNLENARNPNLREKHSYLRENVEVLDSARLETLKDGQEFLPNIRSFVAEGHTSGLGWLLIGQGEGALAFPSDLIPTAHHISLPYIMAYDRCPETTLREKAEFLQRAVSEKWIVVFQHDLETSAARIKRDADGRYLIDQSLSLAELELS